MKPITLDLTLVLVLLLGACQSKEQIEADQLAGNWRITQIIYGQRGSTTIDSSVAYSRAVFEFGSCKLTSSNRECYGYYSLNGLDRTGVTYGLAINQSQLNLVPIDQANRRGFDLTGGFQMQKVNRGLMYLTGPGGYTDSQHRFHLQAFDVKLTLSR